MEDPLVTVFPISNRHLKLRKLIRVKGETRLSEEVEKWLIIKKNRLDQLRHMRPIRSKTLRKMKTLKFLNKRRDLMYEYERIETSQPMRHTKVSKSVGHMKGSKSEDI